MTLPALVLALAPAAPLQLGVERPLAPVPPHTRPRYVQVENGLEPPSLDGGRTELEVCDVDLDGHPDLVSVGDHGSPFVGTSQHGVMVWRGDGSGAFSVVMAGEFGYGGVACGDVNGDGLVDVAYGVHHAWSSGDLGDQLLEVALGDGTAAGWTPWDDGLATAGETWGMFGTDLGDVDSDGDLDVGAASFGCCSGAHVYRNEGDGTWTHAFGFLGGNSDQDFVFCDFTRDGHLDLFVANDTGTAWRGDGAGGFVAADGDLAGSHWRGVAAGDVDGDGGDELAYVASGGGPRVRRWTPGDAWMALDAGLPATGPYDLTQLADVDLDGAVDVVAFGGGELAIWRNGGPSGFQPPIVVAVPGSGSKAGEALEVGGDLDHNGYPDVALVQDESSLFGGGSNELVVLLEASEPPWTFVHPVEPSARRVWRSGQVRFVTWTAGLGPGAAGPGVVTVELSRDGADGPWETLAAAVPNGGRAQVVVPGGPASERCRVRLTWSDGTAHAVALGPEFEIR